MKRFLILLLVVLIGLTVLGCKIKQDKVLDDMAKASRQAADQLNELNKKVDSNAKDVTDKSDEVGESAEEWLDKYEAIVVAYEKKANKKSLSASDMLDINARLSEISLKSESAKVWTPAQANRLGKLSARLTTVVGKYKPQ